MAVARDSDRAPDRRDERLRRMGRYPRPPRNALRRARAGRDHRPRIRQVPEGHARTQSAPPPARVDLRAAPLEGRHRRQSPRRATRSREPSRHVPPRWRLRVDGEGRGDPLDDRATPHHRRHSIEPVRRPRRRDSRFVPPPRPAGRVGLEDRRGLRLGSRLHEGHSPGRSCRSVDRAAAVTGRREALQSHSGGACRRRALADLRVRLRLTGRADGILRRERPIAPPRVPPRAAALQPYLEPVWRTLSPHSQAVEKPPGDRLRGGVRHAGARPADGIVTEAGRNGGYGNLVEIRHANGIRTRYGHLSRFALGLHAGQRVAQEQIIGYVGATGLATGPHLHYEFLVNGRPTNPQRKDAGAGVAVPTKLKSAFDDVRAQLLAELEPSGLPAAAP